MNVNKYEQLQRKWYFHVKYFTSRLFYVLMVYDWKLSTKLLLSKDEVAYVN